MSTSKLTWLLSGLIFLIACKKDPIDSANDNTVTTFAGSVDGFADGNGSAAKFSGLNGIAIDASGNIYVADTYNYRIRKITPVGLVTTLAGNGTPGSVDGDATSARFSGPGNVAVDAQGNVYVTEFNRIRKITPVGQVTTLNNGAAGYADGNLNTALFNDLKAITIDAAGAIYVVDWTGNYPNFAARIRKIAPDGTVSTLAGSGSGGNVNGSGNIAQFSTVYGLTIDSDGNLYAADYGNYCIRKITPAGIVSTVSEIGQVTNGPLDVISDGSGNIYVATSYQVYKVSTSGTSVSLVAGIKVGYADGDGKNASFNGLEGICMDAKKNIFVSDYLNHRIRKIAMKH